MAGDSICGSGRRLRRTAKLREDVEGPRADKHATAGIDFGPFLQVSLACFRKHPDRPFCSVTWLEGWLAWAGPRTDLYINQKDSSLH